MSSKSLRKYAPFGQNMPLGRFANYFMKAASLPFRLLRATRPVKIIAIYFVWMFFTASFLQAQNASFTQVGPVKFPQDPSIQTTGMGRVCQIVFHPTDSNIIFAVSSSGGLWRSINKGATWRSLTDGLPYTRCACLLINPKNPNTMYLGTGDPNYYYASLGVWKTYDGGKTWNPIGKSLSSYLISKMVMSPYDTGVIIAATSNGIYKSINGGSSWKLKSSVDYFRELLMKPNSNNTLYAGSFNSFYYSNDLGESWTGKVLKSKDTMSGIALAVTPADSNVVYAAGWRQNGNPTFFGGMFKSTNSGKTFTKIIDTPNVLGYSWNGTSNDGQGAYNLAIAVDPNNASTVYISAINIWKSINSGKNWTLKSYWVNGVHADKHGMEFSPFNSNELYVNHDGGVDRSTDAGNTWTTISDGLSASEFYTLGQSLTRREICVGGLQDNGVDLIRNNITYTVQGGDGTDDYVFDTKDTSYYYEERYSDRHNANTYAVDYIGSVGIMELSKTDTNVAYCGTYHLERSKNFRAAAASVTWTSISDSVPAILNSISTSRFSSNLLYYSDYYWRLFRSDNILAVKPKYTTLTPPDNSTYVTQVLASPFNVNHVYVSQNTAIYISRNKGKTWVNISKGLPGSYIIKFLADQYDTDTGLYAATYNGIYYTNSKLKKWIFFSTAMPSIASITDLEMYNDSTPKSCIRVATFGRGIWQSSLYRDLNKLPQSNFTVNSSSSSPCPNTYILNDLSEGAISSRQWIISPASGFRYINASDSASRNPEILFTKPGIYYISLKVGNLAGTSLKTINVNITNSTIAASCLPYTKIPCCYYIGIARFELNTIDNSSWYSTDNYINVEDYTCSQSTVLRAGNKYTVYVTNGIYNDENVKMYIDYNNNGSFTDAGEMVGKISPGKGRRSFTFTVPAHPKIVDTFLRLRVMSDFYNLKGPCDTLGYGEAEEYSVMIDSGNPTVKVIVPAQSSSSYTANFKLSEPVIGFDSSDVTVTNAIMSNFHQIDDLNYAATIHPSINRKSIQVSVNANAFSGFFGGTNLAATDSTYFFLGFKNYDLNVKPIAKALSQGNFGDHYLFTLPYGSRKDSLIPNFTLSDTSMAVVNHQPQTSNVSVGNFTNPIVYKIIAKDTTLFMMDTVGVIINMDTACTMIQYAIKSPAATGKISGDSITVLLPVGTNITSLIADYKTANTAKVSVNGNKQSSDTSANNFSTPVTYLVTAQDTNYHKKYEVSISLVTSTGNILKSGEELINIYPQPVNEDLFIDFNLTNGKKVLSLSDIYGQQIAYIETSSNKTFVMKMNTYPKGIYFLKIESTLGSIVKKIVKQ